MIDHPINLFLLYRHWSESLAVWKEFVDEFEISKVSKEVVDEFKVSKEFVDENFEISKLRRMIELAPTHNDCSGKN